MKKNPKPESRAASISLFGGVICLDFVNTVDWRTSDEPEEVLRDYIDLVDWTRHVGIIDDRCATALKRSAARSRAEESRALRQAFVLRDAIYDVFIAVAHGENPAPQDLDRFNVTLSRLMARARISTGRAGFGWTWAGNPSSVDSLLWPISWSAAELLTSQDLRLVRECPGEGCGWLFLDNSRSHRRQWCDMKGCGNRAKARRYYERLKSSG